MDQLFHCNIFKRGYIVVGVAVRAHVWIAGVILWGPGYESVHYRKLAFNRGSQWGGGFYGYWLKFCFFYGYRLIFFSYG